MKLLFLNAFDLSSRYILILLSLVSTKPNLTWFMTQVICIFVLLWNLFQLGRKKKKKKQKKTNSKTAWVGRSVAKSVSFSLTDCPTSMWAEEGDLSFRMSFFPNTTIGITGGRVEEILEKQIISALLTGRRPVIQWFFFYQWC